MFTKGYRDKAAASVSSFPPGFQQGFQQCIRGAEDGQVSARDAVSHFGMISLVGGWAFCLYKWFFVHPMYNMYSQYLIEVGFNF